MPETSEQIWQTLQRLVAAERAAAVTGGATDGPGESYGAAGPGETTPPVVDLATLLGEMAALRSEVRAETLASREQRQTLEQALAALGALERAARLQESAAARAAGVENELRQAAVRQARAADEQRQASGELELRLARQSIAFSDRLEPARQRAETLAAQARRLREASVTPPELGLARAGTPPTADDGQGGRTHRWFGWLRRQRPAPSPGVGRLAEPRPGPALHDELSALAEGLAGLAEGLGLTGARLADERTRLGVQPLLCAGRAFDPATMEAAEVQLRPELPAGTVVEILEQGYRHASGVLRPAKVAVSRPTPWHEDEGR